MVVTFYYELKYTTTIIQRKYLFRIALEIDNVDINEREDNLIIIV